VSAPHGDNGILMSAKRGRTTDHGGGNRERGKEVGKGRLRGYERACVLCEGFPSIIAQVNGVGLLSPEQVEGGEGGGASLKNTTRLSST